MMMRINLGALTMRMGLGGMLCYKYIKEPPKNRIGNYLGPYTLYYSTLIDPLGTLNY